MRPHGSKRRKVGDHLRRRHGEGDGQDAVVCRDRRQAVTPGQAQQTPPPQPGVPPAGGPRPSLEWASFSHRLRPSMVPIPIVNITPEADPQAQLPPAEVIRRPLEWASLTHRISPSIVPTPAPNPLPGPEAQPKPPPAEHVRPPLEWASSPNRFSPSVVPTPVLIPTPGPEAQPKFPPAEGRRPPLQWASFTRGLSPSTVPTLNPDSAPPLGLPPQLAIPPSYQPPPVPVEPSNPPLPTPAPQDPPLAPNTTCVPTVGSSSSSFSSILPSTPHNNTLAPGAVQPPSQATPGPPTVLTPPSVRLPDSIPAAIGSTTSAVPANSISSPEAPASLTNLGIGLSLGGVAAAAFGLLIFLLRRRRDHNRLSRARNSSLKMELKSIWSQLTGRSPSPRTAKAQHGRRNEKASPAPVPRGLDAPPTRATVHDPLPSPAFFMSPFPARQPAYLSKATRYSLASYYNTFANPIGPPPVPVPNRTPAVPELPAVTTRPPPVPPSPAVMIRPPTAPPSAAPNRPPTAPPSPAAPNRLSAAPPSPAAPTRPPAAPPSPAAPIRSPTPSPSSPPRAPGNGDPTQRLADAEREAHLQEQRWQESRREMEARQSGITEGEDWRARNGHHTLSSAWESGVGDWRSERYLSGMTEDGLEAGNGEEGQGGRKRWKFSIWSVRGTTRE